MILSCDTETTGLDLWHGCKPFAVSAMNDSGKEFYWEWKVNPTNREVSPRKGDLGQIQKLIDKADKVVFHNAKFDIRGLSLFGISVPWEKVEDTLLMSHCLVSKQSHKLKDLALVYLDIPDTDEEDLQQAVQRARVIGRRAGWRVARENDPHWPGMKTAPKTKFSDDGWAGADYWLPRAVLDNLNKLEDILPEEPPEDWADLCKKYAMGDVLRTLGLYWCFSEGLKKEGLLYQYEQRRKLLEATYSMEARGITFNRTVAEEKIEGYKQERDNAKLKAIRFAGGKIDNLDSPKQLQAALFCDMGVKGIKSNKTGYSTAAPDLLQIKDSLPKTNKAYHFINNLLDYRQIDKAIGYLESYIVNGMPVPSVRRQILNDWLRINPSYNITGTDTTRLSGSNPNPQNISKQEKRNLRAVFAPLPGREWYSLDYSNIELRIFAYVSGDKRLINAFESGESVHLVIASELYPMEWRACQMSGESFKVKYESTLYQWVKNGNFSLIYGAGQEKADATYHLAGAYARIRSKFPLIDKFMAEKLKEAKDKGYVTTLGGYRLQVPEDGPHKTVNYYVQGSAGWAMVMAIVRVYEFLKLYPDYFMNITIHDELDFDFPLAKRNLAVIREIKRLMELSGEDFGFATPVEVDRINDNWSNGIALKNIQTLVV